MFQNGVGTVVVHYFKLLLYILNYNLRSFVCVCKKCTTCTILVVVCELLFFFLVVLRVGKVPFSLILVSLFLK